MSKVWTPYEQDMSHYPEVFKKFGQNHKMWDEAREKFENDDPNEETGPHHFERQVPKDMSPGNRSTTQAYPGTREPFGSETPICI